MSTYSEFRAVHTGLCSEMLTIYLEKKSAGKKTFPSHSNTAKNLLTSSVKPPMLEVLTNLLGCPIPGDTQV